MGAGFAFRGGGVCLKEVGGEARSDNAEASRFRIDLDRLFRGRHIRRAAAFDRRRGGEGAFG